MIEFFKSLIVALALFLSPYFEEKIPEPVKLPPAVIKPAPKEKLVGLILTEEEQIVDKITADQDAYFALNGKYETTPFTKDGTYEKQIIPYKAPGGYGYQVFLRKVEGGFIKERAETTGVEAGELWRTYDWKIIGEVYDATPTTTP